MQSPAAFPQVSSSKCTLLLRWAQGALVKEGKAVVELAKDKEDQEDQDDEDDDDEDTNEDDDSNGGNLIGCGCSQ